MQLDTDEGEAFVPPAGIVAAPSADQSAQSEERPDTQASNDSEIRTGADG